MTESEFWDKAYLTALRRLVKRNGSRTDTYGVSTAAAEIATSALKERRQAIRSLRPLGIERTEDNGTVKIGN